MFSQNDSRTWNIRQIWGSIQSGAEQHGEAGEQNLKTVTHFEHFGTKSVVSPRPDYSADLHRLREIGPAGVGPPLGLRWVSTRAPGPPPKYEVQIKKYRLRSTDYKEESTDYTERR